MPPAFILSQDQTLQKNLFFRSFELVYFLVLPSFSNYLTFCSVFRDHFTCFLFASCFINIPNFFRYVNDFFYFFIYFFGIFFLLHSLFRECPFNISFYFFSVNPFCENYSIFFDFLQLFSFLLVFAKNFNFIRKRMTLYYMLILSIYTHFISNLYWLFLLLL